MPEQRLLFEKRGRAKYISHLDLMRTFQRIFTRAEVPIKHSEGFNPRPRISIALPLSLGQESVCELLDFTLLGGSHSELPERLNAVSPEGIRVLKSYNAARKIKELTHLEVAGVMEYDNGVPDGAAGQLAEFFAQKSIVMKKKSKSGIADFDIVPCIKRVSFESAGENTLRLSAVITAQTPALNPENLVSAVRQLRPELAPDFVSFCRTEIYDGEGKIFR